MRARMRILCESARARPRLDFETIPLSFQPKEGICFLFRRMMRFAAALRCNR